jgi:hypothetical protein
MINNADKSQTAEAAMERAKQVKKDAKVDISVILDT